MESQRKAILKNLEDKLNAASEESEQYDNQSKQTKKILEQLKQGECHPLLVVHYQIKSCTYVPNYPPLPPHIPRQVILNSSSKVSVTHSWWCITK